MAFEGMAASRTTRTCLCEQGNTVADTDPPITSQCANADRLVYFTQDGDGGST